MTLNTAPKDITTDSATSYTCKPSPMLCSAVATDVPILLPSPVLYSECVSDRPKTSHTMKSPHPFVPKRPTNGTHTPSKSSLKK